MPQTSYQEIECIPEEELISTDSNKGNANPVDEVTDQRVGSINI